MSTLTVVFLGIIAAATLAMAIVQVGVFVAAGLLTRRLGRFVDDIERDVRPILGHVNAVTRDASRAAGLAVAQVERVDQMCADVAKKIEQTLAAIHSGIVVPAREGRAVILGIQAVMAAIREFSAQRAQPHRKEDEDGLFI